MSFASGGPTPDAGEESPRRVIKIHRPRCTFATLPCISDNLRVRLTALYGVLCGMGDRHIHVAHQEGCPARTFGLIGKCICEPEIVLCGRRN